MFHNRNTGIFLCVRVYGEIKCLASIITRQIICNPSGTNIIASYEKGEIFGAW